MTRLNNKMTSVLVTKEMVVSTSPRTHVQIVNDNPPQREVGFRPNHFITIKGVDTCPVQFKAENLSKEQVNGKQVEWVVIPMGRGNNLSAHGFHLTKNDRLLGLMSKEQRAAMDEGILRIPCVAETLLLYGLQLYACGLTKTEYTTASAQRKLNILSDIFKKDSERFTLGYKEDGHIVGMMVLLVDTEKRELLCDPYYVPHLIYNSKVNGTPQVKDVTHDPESCELAFALTYSAKSVQFVKLFTDTGVIEQLPVTDKHWKTAKTLKVRYTWDQLERHGENGTERHEEGYRVSVTLVTNTGFESALKHFTFRHSQRHNVTMTEEAPSTSTTVEAPSTSTTVEAPSTSTTVEAPSTSTTVEALNTSATVEAPSTSATVEALNTSATVKAPSTSATVEALNTSATVEALNTFATVEALNTSATVEAQQNLTGTLYESYRADITYPLDDEQNEPFAAVNSEVVIPDGHTRFSQPSDEDHQESFLSDLPDISASFRPDFDAMHTVNNAPSHAVDNSPSHAVDNSPSHAVNNAPSLTVDVSPSLTVNISPSLVGVFGESRVAWTVADHTGTADDDPYLMIDDSPGWDNFDVTELLGGQEFDIDQLFSPLEDMDTDDGSTTAAVDPPTGDASVVNPPPIGSSGMNPLPIGSSGMNPSNTGSTRVMQSASVDPSPYAELQQSHTLPTPILPPDKVSHSPPCGPTKELQAEIRQSCIHMSAPSTATMQVGQPPGGTEDQRLVSRGHAGKRMLDVPKSASTSECTPARLDKVGPEGASEHLLDPPSGDTSVVNPPPIGSSGMNPLPIGSSGMNPSNTGSTRVMQSASVDPSPYAELQQSHALPTPILPPDKVSHSPPCGPTYDPSSGLSPADLVQGDQSSSGTGVRCSVSCTHAGKRMLDAPKSASTSECTPARVPRRSTYHMPPVAPSSRVRPPATAPVITIVGAPVRAMLMDNTGGMAGLCVPNSTQQLGFAPITDPVINNWAQSRPKPPDC